MDASKYLRIVSSGWIGFTSIILCGEKGLKLKFPIHFGKHEKTGSVYILSSSKGSMQHGNLSYHLRPCDVEAKEPDGSFLKEEPFFNPRILQNQ